MRQPFCRGGWWCAGMIGRCERALLKCWWPTRGGCLSPAPQPTSGQLLFETMVLEYLMVTRSHVSFLPSHRQSILWVSSWCVVVGSCFTWVSSSSSSPSCKAGVLSSLSNPLAPACSAHCWVWPHVSQWAACRVRKGEGFSPQSLYNRGGRMG